MQAVLPRQRKNKNMKNDRVIPATKTNKTKMPGGKPTKSPEKQPASRRLNVPATHGFL
jgi:hypothetical protein